MGLFKQILKTLISPQKQQKIAPSRTTKSAPSKTSESSEGRFQYAASLLDTGPDGYFVEPEDSYDLEIKGESFYQEQLEAIAGPKSEKGTNYECRALLVCEKDNPKDKYAVSVKIQGEVVGFLSKSDAREWRKMLKAEGADTSEVSVAALIVGGWRKTARNGATDEGSFGVKLDVPVDD